MLCAVIDSFAECCRACLGFAHIGKDLFQCARLHPQLARHLRFALKAMLQQELEHMRCDPPIHTTAPSVFVLSIKLYIRMEKIGIRKVFRF